jgi:hypothetical protein
MIAWAIVVPLVAIVMITIANFCSRSNGHTKEIPNPKIQAPEKLQIPIFHWPTRLEFGSSLELGLRNLDATRCAIIALPLPKRASIAQLTNSFSLKKRGFHVGM